MVAEPGEPSANQGLPSACKHDRQHVAANPFVTATVNGREVSLPVGASRPHLYDNGFKTVRAEIRIGLVVAVALARTPSLPSQTTSRSSSAAERVQIDVTVTDSAGHAASGLTESEFEVLQNGKPQKIADFSFVPRHAETPTEGASFKVQPWPGPFPGGIAPDDGHLTLVLMLDDLHLSPAAREPVSRALLAFIDGQIRPGDLVAIVRTAGGTGALQQLTGDKAILHSALAQLRVEATEAGKTEEQSDDAQAESTRFTLRTVLDGLESMQGRKSLLLFSDNMKLFMSPGISDGLTERANRSSVVFYAVDPRGLSPAPLARESSLLAIPADAGLGALARDTGGVFFDNTHDAATVLARVLLDQEGYYRILCSPPEPASDATAAGRLASGITVRLNRPGLRVRTRTGFPLETRPVFGNRQEVPIGQTLPAPPFASGGLRLRLTPLVSNHTASTLEALINIDMRDIALTSDSKGLHNGQLEVVGAVFSTRGSALGSAAQAYSVRIPPENFKRDQAEGLDATVLLPLRVSGPVQVHALVRDVTSGRLGSATQFLNLPDFRSGRLALSGIFLGPATDAPQREPGETASVRVFKAGRSISFAYSILNAGVDAEKRPHVEIQVRIFREGNQIYEGDPEMSPTGPDADPALRARKGNLNLSATARPGQYLLVLSATDKTAPATAPRTATASIDFEVR
ncbi:MAG TPA: VWA domain-containing protein [Bryobacteraceae bacterium]